MRQKLSIAIETNNLDEVRRLVTESRELLHEGDMQHGDLPIHEAARLDALELIIVHLARLAPDTLDIRNNEGQLPSECAVLTAREVLEEVRNNPGLAVDRATAIPRPAHELPPH